MPDGLQLLTKGLKLNVDQEGLIVRVGWIAVVTFHIFWVCGWLGVVGLTPPFAAAGDMQSVIDQLAAQRISMVDSSILDLRIRHCAAQTPESRQLYWGKMAPLLSEYKKITGQTYTLPACADL